MSDRVWNNTLAISNIVSGTDFKATLTVEVDGTTIEVPVSVLYTVAILNNDTLQSIHPNAGGDHHD
ncbi:hypothetical protein [Lacticaseibacillus saniviri]